MIKNKQVLSIIITLIFFIQCMPLYAIKDISINSLKSDQVTHTDIIKNKELRREKEPQVSFEERKKDVAEIYNKTKSKLEIEKKSLSTKCNFDNSVENARVENSASSNSINITGRTFYGKDSLVSIVFEDTQGNVIHSTSVKALDNGNFSADIPYGHLKGYKDYQVNISSNTAVSLLPKNKSLIDTRPIEKIIGASGSTTLSASAAFTSLVGMAALLQPIVDGVEVTEPKFLNDQNVLLTALQAGGKLKFALKAKNTNASSVNVTLRLRLYDSNKNFKEEKSVVATIGSNQTSSIEAQLLNSLPSDVTGYYATGELENNANHKVLTPTYQFPLGIPQDFGGKVIGVPDPAQPGMLKGDKFILGWDSVPGALYYKVYKDNVEIDTIGANTYSGSYETVLADNARIYEFTVKAFSAENSSISSKKIKAAKGDIYLPLSGQTNYILDADCIFEKVHVKSGNLNLAGYTLKTFGTLEISNSSTSASLTLNKGQIFVLNNGDFTVGNNNSGTYNGSTFSMIYPEDYIYVQGNFYFKSSVTHNSSYLNAGTLEVQGGTFKKEGSGQFLPGNTHCVALTRSVVALPNEQQKQTIDFNNDQTSQFNILRINKPLSTGYSFLPASRSTPWYKTLEDTTYYDLHTGDDGIQAATGNFSRTYTDLTLEAPGLDFNIGRVYNSNYVYRKTRRGTTLGKGWFFSYEGSIEDEAITDGVTQKSKLVYLPGGEMLRFTYTGTVSTSTTFTPDYNRSQLKFDGTKYILTMKDWTVYEFNSSGWLTGIKDTYNNKLNIQVDAKGKVDQISDRTGRTFKVIYNDSVKKEWIIKIEDWKGSVKLAREINYTYYPEGLLKSVSNALNNVTYMYKYTSNDYLKEIRDGYDKLIESVTFFNAASGKIQKTTDAFGKETTVSYEASTGRTYISDNGGRSPIIQGYNTKFGITKTIDPDGKFTFVDLNEYGEESEVTDRDGNKTTYTRDSNGNVTSILNPDGSTQYFGYYTDSIKKNLMKWELDEEGNYAYYGYDDKRQLLHKCIYRGKVTYNPNQMATYEYNGTNGSNYIMTKYEYYNTPNSNLRGYEAGLLYAEIEPNYAYLENPPKKIYDYDEFGTLKSVIDASLCTTLYENDEITRKPKVIKKPTFTTADGSQYCSATFNYYDSNGQLERSTVCDSYNEATASEKSTTRYVYDIMGRLIQKVMPRQYYELSDNLAGHTYNDSTVGYRYTYYRGSQEVEKEIDPENYERKYLSYDVYGNLILEQKPANNPQDPTDLESTMFMYEYDSVNVLKRVYHVLTYTTAADGTINVTSKELLEEYDESVVEPVVDGGTNNFYHLKKTKKYYNDTDYATTLMKIDYDGRLCKTIYEPDSTTEKVEITNEYYKNGEIKSTTDGMGYKTLYSYGYETTGAKREVEHIWTPVDANSSKTTYYSYKRIVLDNNGNTKEENIKRVKLSADSTTGEPAGRSTIEAEATSSSTYYTTISTYDDSNRLMSITDYDGKKTAYVHDDAGNVEEKYEYTDPSYNPATAIRTTYVYNYLDKPVREILYVRKGDISTNNFTDDTLTTLETVYDYDTEGNNTVIYDPYPAISGSIYYYDYLGRISAEGRYRFGGATLKTYSRNWEGNPIYQTDYAGNKTYYKYNWQNMPEEIKTSVTTWIGTIDTLSDCITSFSYDRAGRKIAEVSPSNYIAGKTAIEMDNRATYEYDKFDRITYKKFTGKEKKVDAVTGQWATDVIVTNRTLAGYQYDKNGNVVKETDAAGYSTDYVYTPQDQIERTLDQVNKDRKNPYASKYLYDVLGRISKETYVKNDTNNSSIPSDDSAKGMEISYDYSLQSFNTLNYPSVKKSITSYDGYTNITGLVESSRYDLVGNILEYKKYINSTNFNTINFAYNKMKKVQKMDVPYSDSTQTLKISTTVCQYDTIGNTKKVQAQMDTPTDTSDDICHEYGYDTFGNVTYQKTSRYNGTEAISRDWEYDVNGNIIKEYDGRDNLTSYTYDELNRLKSKSITVNGKEHTSYTKYNLDGNPVRTMEFIAETFFNSITCNYDYMGRLVEKIDNSNGNASIEKVEYNTRDLQDKSYHIFEENGTNIYVATSFTYDNNGNLYTTKDPQNSETKVTYDNHGNVKTKVDGSNNTTTYTYDCLNRLRQVTNPMNESTNFVYDFSNNLLTMTTGGACTTTYEYNSFNKVKMKIDHGGVTTDVNGNKVYDYSKVDSYIYYPDGTLKSHTDRNEETTTYVYDCHGRLKTQTTGTTGSMVISYDYDNDGNPTNVTMQDNSTVRKEIISRQYDELNRVTVKSMTKDSDTLPYLMLNYIYDIITTDGLLAEKSIDSRYNITTKVYDLNLRLKYVIDGSETGTDKTQYDYSKDGNRKSVTYPGGAKEEYTYFRDNLVKKLINRKQDGTILDEINYTYDYAKNQTSKNEMVINGVTKGTTYCYYYYYDGLNRLKKVSEPADAQGNVKNIYYSYDGEGNRNVESVLYGTTQTTKIYNYTKQNRVDNIQTYTTQYVSDLTPTYTSNGSGTLQKDKSNEGRTLTLNGVKYDKGLGAHAASELRYNLSGLGFRHFSCDIGVDDEVNGTSASVKFKVYLDSDTTPVYDSGIMNSDSATKSIFINVTGKSQLKLVVEAVDTNAYDHADWADAKLTKGTATTEVYSYDDNGNLLTERKGGKTYTHTYNKLNQLSTTTFTEGTQTVKITNTYNGEGYRIEKTVLQGTTSTTTRYIYEKDKVILELNGTNVQARNIYGSNLLKRIMGSDSYYYMYNAHGDVIALLNATTGQVAATYNYDAFGNIITSTGTVKNNITYAGYQYDSETKLYYLNSRMYDPLTARFLQEDTYSGDPNDPLSLNLYTYCHNSPIMYSDPDGHKVKWNQWDDVADGVFSSIADEFSLPNPFEIKDSIGALVDLAKEIVSGDLKASDLVSLGLDALFGDFIYLYNNGHKAFDKKEYSDPEIEELAFHATKAVMQVGSLAAGGAGVITKIKGTITKVKNLKKSLKASKKIVKTTDKIANIKPSGAQYVEQLKELAQQSLKPAISSGGNKAKSIKSVSTSKVRKSTEVKKKKSYNRNTKEIKKVKKNSKAGSKSASTSKAQKVSNSNKKQVNKGEKKAGTDKKPENASSKKSEPGKSDGDSGEQPKPASYSDNSIHGNTGDGSTAKITKDTDIKSYLEKIVNGEISFDDILKHNNINSPDSKIKSDLQFNANRVKVSELQNFEKVHALEPSKVKKMQSLTDEELLNSFNNPLDGDFVTINDRNGISQGHHRINEILNRMNDPKSMINGDMIVKIERRTRNFEDYFWDLI